MLLKILLVGVLITGCMAALRDGRLLRRAGLFGSCDVISATQTDQSVQRCRQGRLDGYPNLENKACQLISSSGGYEYWHCLAPIVSSQSPRG